MKTSNNLTLFNNIDKYYEEIVLKREEETDFSVSSNNSIQNSELTCLFADFGGCTKLIDNYDVLFSKWVLKSYLACVSHLILMNEGEIIAFEGDGIMGLFSGIDKENNAVKCAFNIQWAVSNIIQPKIDLYFPEYNYKIYQVVGIDTSELTSIKTNIWNSYDILWVGRAANYSANLTKINNINFSTYITENVLQNLSNNYNQPMWEMISGETFDINVFRSNFMKPF